MSSRARLGTFLGLGLLAAFALDTASTLWAAPLGSEANPLVPAPPSPAYLVSAGLRLALGLALLVFLPRSLEPRLVAPSPWRLWLVPFPYRGCEQLLVVGLAQVIVIKLAAAASNAAFVLWGSPLLPAGGPAGLILWLSWLGVLAVGFWLGQALLLFAWRAREER